MPRQTQRIATSWFTAEPAVTGECDGRPLPTTDSTPRDWSELGRRVLAEALRRATDELALRNAMTPASAAIRSIEECQS
ncbi:MAG: hypothetical protein PVJ57_16650 [Phycisphaerae bacterium]|jgi:hypothetical protein